MEQFAEDLYINALNKIEMSIRCFSNWIGEYPNSIDLSINELLNNLRTDRKNLRIILQGLDNSPLAAKRRLSILRQIDFFIEQLELYPLNKITANQGTIFHASVFFIVEQRLSEIVRKPLYFNSRPIFERSPYSQFDHRPLCKILYAMKTWLNGNYNLNYVDFHDQMNQYLAEIKNLAISKTTVN